MLRQHCERHCGAQNLTVVVVGAEPLPKLQRTVSAVFGAVPRAPVDAPDYSTMPLPFEGTPLDAAAPRRSLPAKPRLHHPRRVRSGPGPFLIHSREFDVPALGSTQLLR